MKLKSIFCSVLFFAAGLVTNAFAQNYVYDEGNILSSSEKEMLNNQIEQVVSNHENTLGIYIATIPSFFDYAGDIEDAAEEFYLQNNLGAGEQKTGILFILSMNERQYDICAYGDLSHTAYTDYGKSKLAENSIKYLKNDAWYFAFKVFVEKADRLLTRTENGDPFDSNDSIIEFEGITFVPRIFIISLLSAMLGSFIVALIITLALRGKMSNVKLASTAAKYVESSQICFTQRNDVFTHVTEHKTPINTNNSGGSSHGGGGTHVNSGGFSHSSGRF